eukprot:TRINITY_DN4224_c0_g1_i6.p1 TRINITY_DN4224_c0_g1~~TRINITY_DN4224_c0_g1_i6.p1  ORF type:complete len:567 (-),score=30.68 TRINITY_DN4224_c0_g1_i6:12-1712(-)
MCIRDRSRILSDLYKLIVQQSAQNRALPIDTNCFQKHRKDEKSTSRTSYLFSPSNKENATNNQARSSSSNDNKLSIYAEKENMYPNFNKSESNLPPRPKIYERLGKYSKESKQISSPLKEISRQIANHSQTSFCIDAESFLISGLSSGRVITAESFKAEESIGFYEQAKQEQIQVSDGINLLKDSPTPNLTEDQLKDSLGVFTFEGRITKAHFPRESKMETSFNSAFNRNTVHIKNERFSIPSIFDIKSSGFTGNSMISYLQACEPQISERILSTIHEEESFTSTNRKETLIPEAIIQKENLIYQVNPPLRGQKEHLWINPTVSQPKKLASDIMPSGLFTAALLESKRNTQRYGFKDKQLDINRTKRSDAPNQKEKKRISTPNQRRSYKDSSERHVQSVEKRRDDLFAKIKSRPKIFSKGISVFSQNRKNDKQNQSLNMSCVKSKRSQGLLQSDIRRDTESQISFAGDFSQTFMASILSSNNSANKTSTSLNSTRGYMCNGRFSVKDGKKTNKSRQSRLKETPVANEKQSFSIRKSKGDIFVPTSLCNSFKFPDSSRSISRIKTLR